MDSSAPMGSSPQRPESGPRPDGASVHLTRFTIQPDRRSELLDAARSQALPERVPANSDWRLLVELDDGDWLQVSIGSDGESSDDGLAYLELATGLLGDEDGVIVSCSRLRNGNRSDPSRATGPDGRPRQ